MTSAPVRSPTSPAAPRPPAIQHGRWEQPVGPRVTRVAGSVARRQPQAQRPPRPALDRSPLTRSPRPPAPRGPPFTSSQGTSPGWGGSRPHRGEPGWCLRRLTAVDEGQAPACWATTGEGRVAEHGPVRPRQVTGADGGNAADGGVRPQRVDLQRGSPAPTRGLPRRRSAQVHRPRSHGPHSSQPGPGRVRRPGVGAVAARTAVLLRPRLTPRPRTGSRCVASGSNPPDHAGHGSRAARNPVIEAGSPGARAGEAGDNERAPAGPPVPPQPAPASAAETTSRASSCTCARCSGPLNDSA